MVTAQLNQYAAAVCGVLHNLYFSAPTPEFLAQFRQDQLIQSWPDFGTAVEHHQAQQLMLASLQSDSDDRIKRDYYQLFVGPGEMAAYPWGSVYTDKENLLFGASERAFSGFLQRWQVEVTLDQHQPLDHIGIMLGVLGQLLDNEQTVAVDELLQDHLMPWAPRLLERVDMEANSGFYRGVSKLTAQLLQRLVSERGVEPKPQPLYK